MKKFLSFVLAAMMVLTMTVIAIPAVSAADETFSVWDGTAGDKTALNMTKVGDNYIIDSAEDFINLQAYSAVSTNTCAGLTFIITVNLDLNNKEYTPIGGFSVTQWAGTLIGSLGDTTGNGGPITIKNLYTSKANQNVGLIGRANGATVKNMRMIDSTIIDLNKNSVGSFVGYAAGTACTFENLYSNASITVSTSDAANSIHVGGIVGYNAIACTYKNCVFEGTINVSTMKDTTSTGTCEVGGIVGWVQAASTLTDCSVKASIDATGTNLDSSKMLAVGGIVGYNSSGQCDVVGATVKATLKGTRNIGGIVGDSTQGGCLYQDCFVDVVIEGTSNCGGVAGYARGKTFKNIIVLGDITGNGEHTGGVIGSWNKAYGSPTPSSMENVYVGAAVRSTGSKTGGLVGTIVQNTGTNGTINLTFKNCQFDGAVYAKNTQAGLFLGRLDNGVTGTTNTVVTFENCLNSGVMNSTYAIEKRFALIGLMADYPSAPTVDPLTGNVTFTKVYDMAHSSLFAQNDYDATGAKGTTVYNVTVDGVKTTVTNTNAGLAGESNSMLLGFRTLVCELGENPFETADAVWTTVKDGRPVLTIAKDDAVKTYEKADLGWFDNLGTSYTVATEAEALGLAKLAQTFNFGDRKVYVRDTLTTALPTSTAIVNVPILLKGIQQSGTDLRIVAGLDGISADLVGYRITLGEVSKEVTGTTVYESIQGDKLYTAEELNATYLSALTVKNLPATGTVTFTVTAFLKTGDTAAYGSSAEITMTDGAIVSAVCR